MKKRGKKIKHTDCVNPLGIKGNKYEIDARMALVAMQNNVCKESHLVDLYILADICDRLGAKADILTHCHAVKRICDEVFNAGYQCNELRAISMSASVDILLNWFVKQNNLEVFKVAQEAIREMAQ